jgi:magnesium-transporting ATPase (P-type)
MGGDEEITIVYPDNHDGLSSAEAAARLEKYGRNELAEKSTPGWVIFARCLWGPMPIALWIAIVIEFSHWKTTRTRDSACHPVR